MSWCLRICERLCSVKDEPPLALSVELSGDRAIPGMIGARLGLYSVFLPKKAALFVGWGARRSGERAKRLANRYNSPYLLLEDGFLRSFKKDGPRLSTVADRQNPHFVSAGPTDFERAIACVLSNDQTQRARRIAQLWRDARLSKYNDLPEPTAPLPKDFVLVVDQVPGDKSIELGSADRSSFTDALGAALAENPDSQVVVKVHPDASNYARVSHFDLAELNRMDRVQVVSEACHIVSFLEQATAVYVVTSQVGFEALIWRKKVRVFGMPFYAGWGLTIDEQDPPQRRSQVTFEQLIHGTLIDYAQYHDPVTAEPVHIEEAVASLALQRRMTPSISEQFIAVGFSPWKRPFIRDFLGSENVRFVRRKEVRRALPSTGTVVVWGSGLRKFEEDGRALLRMEDGFMRSAGLGASLVRPISLVVDRVGIYYDATRPSELEQFLATHRFTNDEVERARALRQRVVNYDITKYNLGGEKWKRPTVDKTVILVVGQVESDASVAFGSPRTKTNIDLARMVRQKNSDAYLVYKPHPDVMAGYRSRGIGDKMISELCDEVLTKSFATEDLVSQVDEVHTMTSLLGFEALLRGSQVVCYGMPFYAGWGLTEDMLKCDRRNRKLRLDELVYGALVQYPRYHSQKSWVFLEPEQALDELLDSSQRRAVSQKPHFRRLLQPLFYVAQISKLFRS